MKTIIDVFGSSLVATLSFEDCSL